MSRLVLLPVPGHETAAAVDAGAAEVRMVSWVKVAPAPQACSKAVTLSCTTARQHGSKAGQEKRMLDQLSTRKIAGQEDDGDRD
jgi:hypothetical protein